jgi:DNA-binding NarL/FixJ family response regulator
VSEPIKILIADDQRLMREGLKTILDLEEGFRVIALAANGREACMLCLSNPPDVVLMDIRMPEMDGVEATQQITADDPAIKVIILTTFDDDELIVSGLKAGAKTYLLKDLPSEKLAETIRSIHQGTIVMQPEIAARLVERAAAGAPETAGGPDACLIEPLTRREKEILKLMADGLGNGEIAAKLYLSEGTVKNHISTIYSKLGLNDRTQAVLFALKNHLL